MVLFVFVSLKLVWVEKERFNMGSGFVVLTYILHTYGVSFE